MKHRNRITAVLALIGAASSAACSSDVPVAPRESEDAPDVRFAKGNTQAIVLTKLPSLGSNSEALAVDGSGTVITGQSFDRAGMLYAVKWTLVAGSWSITTLAYTGSAAATGVNDQGDAVGYGATYPRRALLWSSAGVARLLDCAGDVGESQASGVSASGQVAAGSGAGTASIWRGNGCRETLPSPGSYSSVATANGNGTILGGSAAAVGEITSMPARWREVAGAWSFEQLDTRTGRAIGSNPAGDLAGYVMDSCGLADGCHRSVVWYAAGGSRAIDAGGERHWAVDVNSSGEVAGIKTSNGRSSAYLWSEASGLRDLAVKGKDAGARAVSNVRSDGTRLVVGVVGAQAAAWLVRN